VDETCIKIWVEDTINGVMDESISYTRLVDVSAFRVSDDEVFVATVGVCTRLQFTVEVQNVGHQGGLEF
jgi:hypothetical protein